MRGTAAVLVVLCATINLAMLGRLLGAIIVGML